MKVLHVISQRPDSTGSGMYLQEIIRQAWQAGHRNFLVAALQTPEIPQITGIAPEDADFVRFEREDYPHKIIGMSDVMPYPSRSFRSLDETGLKDYLDLFRRRLVAGVQRWQPELIHCHHLWLLTSMVRLLFPDLPVVASCHGSELRQVAQCPHLLPHVLPGCRSLDRILALSRQQMQEIRGVYDIDPERINVAGAGFNAARFFSGPPAPSSSPPQLLYAGKISRAKGVPWLLEALASIHQFPFHLHIAGGGAGAEYQECMALAALLGSRITFHGILPQDPLARLMRRCRAFILPSLHEGIPLVVLEALASGCLVIATDLPGTIEIGNRLKTKRLRLISTPSLEDIDATTLTDDRRFVQELRSSIIDVLARPIQDPGDEPDLHHYSWDAVYSRIEAVWQNLVQPR